MPEPNPYSTPAVQPDIVAAPSDIDPVDQKKMDAVIKDANQFWLAILLCFLCSAIGAILIPFWYFVRLRQWTALSRKYPLLMTESQPGSLAAKFQACQWKLIAGIVVGAVVMLMLITFILLPLLFVQ